MPKILVRGRPFDLLSVSNPVKVGLKVTCKKCSSELETTEEDIEHARPSVKTTDEGIITGWWVGCPVCGTYVFFYKEE